MKIKPINIKYCAIVGGAGFIGSHFVDYFLKNNIDCVVVDNLSSGSLERIPHNSTGCSFINLDVRNTVELSSVFENADLVIHLASNPDIAKAEHFPRIDFENGTELTESVLEAARLSKVPRFIYASGSGVYAESGLKPIREDSPLQPISTYGASKLAGEALLSSYCYMFGIQGSSFRFANVVGSRQTHGVGYDFVKKLKHNPYKLDVLGNGSQTKSYISVEDVIDGIVTVLHEQSIAYDVYNIATEDFLTVTQIANIAIEILGLTNVEINYGKSDKGWKADVPQILLDTSKLRKLGWMNKLTSEEAMRNSIISMK